MTLKYLITGATGGLGSQVLKHLSNHLPSSDYAAASSNEASRAQFEKAGITFRLANFDDPATLEAAFADVENLYFVSTNTFDNARRTVQHRNVIEAAKRVGVRHVWYTSLAFGGLGSDSKMSVQQAHLETEKMLKEAGITYTSIREGIYADAFPLFLQWYPTIETIILPSDGVITYTSRDELGEANAKLLLKGGHENEIILLTANEPLTGGEIIKIINETTGRNVKLQLVSPEEYIKYHTENDIGKKPESFWQQRISWFEGIAKGDADLKNPLMREVLGREPKTGSQLIRELLTENRDYTWHQNYIDKAQYEATLKKEHRNGK
ncbi:NmrA-like family protein, putative [Talaromyces stipitatus ATCC 10500]|uniref:NmrA-like family protein, putative n=1 Tax=Talaromyces stipitatus (strain ATCC 10500 / CBS 375.48 / QM 6759 / NRRL 1006) TaxID=441959 RepID=B8MCF1_TALSN|nr:NmrA-like family protein, putative [Talaromyces stipitatus ATCC 10500]EED18767.1 NmrA-like family protein, putative [Talaromyces stipitatus ATCC 10500]